jgi:hypothetical protein
MAGARGACVGVALLASGSGARRLPARPGPYPPGDPFDARRPDRDRWRDRSLCEPFVGTRVFGSDRSVGSVGSIRTPKTEDLALGLTSCQLIRREMMSAGAAESGAAGRVPAQRVVGAGRRVVRVAGKRGEGGVGRGCWVVGVGWKPAMGGKPAVGRGPAGAAGAAPGPGHRLNQRWPRPVLTVEQLLEGRVEHRPAGPCCAGCRHLGALVRVPDGAGARRWRRRCAHRAGGFTEPGWPACGSYEEEGDGAGAGGAGAGAGG